MSAAQSYLLDGPLMALGDARQRLLEQMTNDLLAQRAYGTRGDAIRTLTALEYQFLDIYVLVDDAIYLAKQEIVAREISPCP